MQTGANAEVHLLWPPVAPLGQPSSVEVHVSSSSAWAGGACGCVGGEAGGSARAADGLISVQLVSPSGLLTASEALGRKTSAPRCVQMRHVAAHRKLRSLTSLAPCVPPMINCCVTCCSCRLRLSGCQAAGVARVVLQDSGGQLAAAVAPLPVLPPCACKEMQE
jgi:hypothetical protein